MRLGREALGGLPAGVPVPGYLDQDIRIGIVHFGVGNFHRAHQAMYLDRLLGAGLARDFAICGVGLLDRDAGMRDALVGQDGLYTLTLRHPDGRDEMAVIGSIRRYLYAPDDPESVLEQLADPGVRIVSLTITEGGYPTDPAKGKSAERDPLVAQEVAEDLVRPLTAFGWIVAGLRERRRHGIAPFTVLSCDNVQGNGEVARLSVLDVAGMVDPELAGWIGEDVSFPSTMVDRITPATTDTDRQRVRDRLGVEDAWPVACEPFEQWVVQDSFPSGRPPWEAVGVTLTQHVEQYETIKLRLLNGGHQALAYVGQLAGYTQVHESLGDDRVSGFARGYVQAAIPTVSAPDGFDLAGYVDTMFDRFGNPSVADTLARLSVDASNRIPTFVVPTIVDLLTEGRPARAGACLLASWREFVRQVAAGRFVMDDEAAEALIDAAEGDPVRFLRETPTLAALAESDTFLVEFTDAAKVLTADGVGALFHYCQDAE